MFARYGLAFVLNPVLFTVSVFVLLRALLYVVYPDFFSSLSGNEVVQAFLHGLRFDFSITALLYSILLLVLILSVVSGWIARFRIVLLWMAFLISSAAWGIYGASIAYFGEVHRHLATEILYISEDTGFLLTLLSSSRVLWFLAGSLILLLLAVLWQKIIIQPARMLPAFSASMKSRTLFAVAAIATILLFSRGFILTGKSISLVDAYSLGNEKQAALAMNGAFSVVHNVRRASKNDSKAVRYFPAEELEEFKASGDMPSFRRTIPSFYAPDSQARNVVIILLESWGSAYIDALAGTNYGATPFMDSIIRQSSVWTQTYAAGQRSIEGIQAILTSVPLLEGQRTIGWGLEQNRMTTLASEAEKQGYHTVMMQTSARRSFHVDAIAGAIGFSSYYGMEDFPELRDYPVDTPTFGWDYEGLMFFADYMHRPENTSRPLFSFFFTGTSHEPFPDPGAQFHLFPHGEDNIKSYLNTLHYSDWSLQQFMERMSHHPRYNNTVFIFVADHVLKASSDSRYESFRIPLIIYSPDGSIPAQTITEVASQYDVLPTVASLLGVTDEISTFGRSLLTESELSFKGALSKQGSSAVWLAEDQWASFSGISGELHASGGEQSTLEAAIRWNKMRMQAVSELLKNNRWAPIM